MDKTINLICDIIENSKDELIEFGRDIFYNGETGYKEFRTAGKLKEKLEGLGLSVRDKITVTGLKAEIVGGEGKNIALMGELDALPIPTHKFYNAETCGAHACGHNIQVAAIYGAAKALSHPDVIKELGGKVTICGVPAEEGLDEETRTRLMGDGTIRYLGGKNEWLRTHEFDDIDIAIGCHAAGGKGALIVNNSCNGFVTKTITINGKSTHAASPHNGINAQTASNLAMLAIDSQKDCFDPNGTVSIHGVVKQAGLSPSTITDKVVLEYVIRAKDKDCILTASKKVDDCIKGACIATGATATIDTRAGYLPWTPLPSTKEIYDAIEPLATEDAPTRQMQGHISASSDVGDLSALMPLYQIFMGGSEGDAHSNEFYIKDEYACYVTMSKALALAAYNFLRDGGKTADRVCSEFKAPMTFDEYIDYKESLTNTVEVK